MRGHNILMRSLAKPIQTMNTITVDQTAIMVDKANYPRTGRRGVPQQFPRKLYEMLEAESNGTIVHWSSSGRAFRIADVSLFTQEILGKYFKTSKFSSFQRNLNLVSLSFDHSYMHLI